MRKSALRVIVLLATFTAFSAMAMTLTSQDVQGGARVPNAQVYGDCNGDNVSPELSWRDAPELTRSFALTVFDPDAPGGGWWHWIAFDIPASAREVPRGAGNPAQLYGPAVQGTSDFGSVGYGGPCPPAGDSPHRYEFTLWALDAAKAPFGSDVTGARILPWLKAHSIAKTTLTAKYGR